MKRIYLDANGSCPPMPCAQDKIRECLEMIGNPSSFHAHGQAMGAIIHDARQHVAKSVGAIAKEVIFTSGASEANRIFLDSLVVHSQKLGRRLSVLMSPFEHPSLLKPMLAASSTFDVDIMPLDEFGQIAPDFTQVQYDVVICTSAHNETGIIPDFDQLLSQISDNCILMSDISQSYARLAPPPKRVDVLTCSAQKIGGFAGSGALILRERAKILPPPWQGGGQERGIRPGTEAFLLIAAFGEAAKNMELIRSQHQQIAMLRDHFEAKLKEITNVKIVGESLPRLPNTSAVTFVGQDHDFLRISCDLAGLSVGFGSACSGLAPEGSFALKRLGLSLADEKCTVRFSFSPDATKADVDETIARLTAMLPRAT